MRHLGAEVVPLADLDLFPGNPRVGDVEEIMGSLARFGQFRSVVVREAGEGRRRQVLAGNHTTIAASRLAALPVAELVARYGPGDPDAGWRPAMWAGATSVRADVIECDDGEARRINAADNRLAELGAYDDDLLAALLSSMGEGELAGTGWTAEDLAALAPSGPSGPPDFPDLDRDSTETDYRCPGCGYEWSGQPKPQVAAGRAAAG